MNGVQEIPPHTLPGAGIGTSEGVEERWMEIDGARMRYLQTGSGPPLILLHGLLAYSFSWRYTMPALAPYATAFAPDLLGAGFSDRPKGLDHSMRGTALRVLRFADQLGLETFDLLGTSRGGAPPPPPRGNRACGGWCWCARSIRTRRTGAGSRHFLPPDPAQRRFVSR